MVTIITETAVERALLAELDALGARGYTITDARGKGSRGVRQSDWTQEGNIRVEVICEASLAERIAARVREKYYDHYAMVLFMQDVQVLRPEKF
jgi:nitrogen regulatory protein PII